MRRFTSPTFTLTLTDIDITDESSYKIYVTFKQGNVVITKTGTDISRAKNDTNTVLTVSLSQQDSSAFDAKEDCRIQVNWVDLAGNRAATGILSVRVYNNLLEEVIDP